jgi:NADPH:quinone reductase-like Zn-dependent oxidoreductase
MRVLEVVGEGGLQNLVLQDRPAPTPGPGEVVVQVKAASLNRRDLSMVNLKAAGTPPTPFVPMSDACGVVTAVGAGVTSVRVGERVVSMFFQRWLSGPVTPEVRWSTLGMAGYPGIASDYVTLLEMGVHEAPDVLSDAEASTLPCAALTAWRAMFEDAQLQAGAKVLIQGTGGVSIFGLQFAVAMGMEAIVTSSSDEKLERARALGAAHGVNYRTHPEWAAQVKALAGKAGVDFVLGVGGGGSLAQSMEAIRLGGHIAIVGNLSGAEEAFSTRLMIGKNIRLQGVSVGSRDMFGRMVEAIETHKIRPVIDRTYPLAQAHEAFEAMGRGEHFGKIVMDFNA